MISLMLNNFPMTKKPSVLVIGATGNQGGSVVKAILPKGYRIRTITRNLESPAAKKLIEQGVEIMKGDFSDSDSLIKAATGVDTVYAMTTPFQGGPEAEVKQGIAIVDAVKKADVGHLIFGSVANADRKTGIPHFDSKYEVEKHVASLNIPYTISAPVYFMDNYLTPMTLPLLKEGKLSLGMPPNRPLQQISVNNIGAFVAALVERRDKVFGKRIDIAGDELTGEQTVAILSKAIGHKIKYEGFDPEILQKESDDLAAMYKWFNDVGYSVEIEKLHKDYAEVKWQSLEDWAQEQDWDALI